MSFIDVHAHAFLEPYPGITGKPVFSSPEQLLKRYDELDVEKGVLLPLVSPEFYLPQSNEEVLRICSQYPDRFIPFCNIDPRAVSNSANADIGYLLKHYKERGCKGIGEITALLPFSHPFMQNLFKHVEQANMPLTFHIACKREGDYGIYDDPGLPQFEETLKTFPNLKFFCHSTSFWAEIGVLDDPSDRGTYPTYPIRAEGVVPNLMRKYPNIYGDLSAGSGYNALARDVDYAIQFIHEFQDRLMFGLDICDPNGNAPLPSFLLKLLDEGKINEAIFNKIARENVIRLLELE